MSRRLVLAVAVTATMALLGRAMIGALLSATAGLGLEASPDRLAALGIQGLVLVVGLAYAAWLGLTAAASALALTLNVIGHASGGLEDLIRRSGAPMVRRLANVSVASSMLLVPAYGLAPAVAAPVESGPDVILIDLGWDAHHEDPPQTTAPSPPLSLSLSPSPSPEPAAKSPTPPPTKPPGPTSSAPEHPSPPVTMPAAPVLAAPALPAPPPAAITANAPSTGSTDSVSAHKVAPGDSLWSIAAARAGADASVAEIGALWPRWYEANRSTIGANPDLIHPGMVLHAPTQETP